MTQEDLEQLAEPVETAEQTERQIEDRTTDLELTLTLPEKTIKKLKAYAMLSGISLQQIENEVKQLVQPILTQYLDETLTRNIAHLLGQLDGATVRVESQEEVQAAAAETDEHAVSQDDDNESNPSVEEQAAEIEQELRTNVPKPLPAQSRLNSKAVGSPTGSKRATRSIPPTTPSPAEDEPSPFQIDVPDAGNNAEAFLDQAMTAPAAPQPQAGLYGGMTGATRQFNPSKPRVKVGEYTGDESGFFS